MISTPGSLLRSSARTVGVCARTGGLAASGLETVRELAWPFCSANREATSVISPPMLEHWKGLNIPALLRELLERPSDFAIHLDNDANMGALGESRFGLGRGSAKSDLYQTEHRIGSGLILNGQLFRGETGVAGEFGHMQIQFGHGQQRATRLAPPAPAPIAWRRWPVSRPLFRMCASNAGSRPSVG